MGLAQRPSITIMQSQRGGDRTFKNIGGSDPINIGRRFVGEYSEGSVDDFFVLDRALSVAEVSTLYSSPRTQHRAPPRPRPNRSWGKGPKAHSLLTLLSEYTAPGLVRRGARVPGGGRDALGCPNGSIGRIGEGARVRRLGTSLDRVQNTRWAGNRLSV